MPFQSTVNLQQAAAVAGDFASANPRSSVVSHEGGFVAGTGGLTVGRFAWYSGNTVLNSGSGTVGGFVHREQGSALISTYLAEYGNLIPAGFAVNIMRSGDYWATVTVNAATVGQKAFASTTDGTVQFAAAGATISGYVETNFYCTGFPIGGTGAVGELVTISSGI